MRLRKPLTETICSHCSLKYLCNDHEVAPDVVRCPRCGHEHEIEWPPAYEEKLGCGPLIVAAVVLFGLTKIFGGGGILGGLLGIVLGLGIPVGLAVITYHLMRSSGD